MVGECLVSIALQEELIEPLMRPRVALVSGAPVASAAPVASVASVPASATGTVAFWIKVPTVSHTAGTVIYIFYGNSSVAADQSNKTGVWDSQYKTVLHFADNAANTIVVDSTGNANGTNSANTNVAATSTGKIGYSFHYRGPSSADYTTIPQSGTSLSATTVEFWLNPDATPGSQAGYFQWANGLNSGTPFVLVAQDTGGNLKIYVDGNYRYTAALPNNAWTSVAITLSGSSQWNAYVNGAQVLNYAGGVTFQSNAASLYFGDGYSTYALGKIDEGRVSIGTARSGGWIATEYSNESNPAAFYSVGAGSSATSSLVGEAITASGITYGRYFYASDAYRDANGNVTSTSSGNFYDPSTKMVTVVVTQSSSTLVSFSSYLTRWNSAGYSQTDWSGGSNQNAGAETSTNAQFSTSSNVVVNAPGTITLSQSPSNSCSQ